MTYFGWPSLCLKVRDLEASRRFYTRMGMHVVSEVEGLTVILGYGTFRLALMTFLESNVLNFRAGDVFQVSTELKSEFPKLAGEAERYTREKYDADADGVCWSISDPDGNNVFFDTNELEVGPEYVRSRSLQILRGAAAELEMLGADPGLLDSLKREVIGPYSKGE